MIALIAWARRYIAAAGATLLVMLGLYAKSRADAKTKAAARDAAAYRDGRGRMDYADTDIHGVDPDAARRLMRERDTNQR